MNLKQAIETSRILLNEKQHNINQGYSDSILSDSLIVFWVNEFVRKLEHDLGLTTFTQEEVLYNIPVVAGQEYYNFPSDVQRITNLMITKDTYIYHLTQEINYFTKENIKLKGIPTRYVLDYNPGTIKLYPIPNDDFNGYTLKFTGIRTIKNYTLKDIDKELPFDARFHTAFVYFICGSMVETLIDNDNGQINRSKIYYRKVDEIVSRYKNDILFKRDSYNSIRFDNDIYNT